MHREVQCLDATIRHCFALWGYVMAAGAASWTTVATVRYKQFAMLELPLYEDVSRRVGTTSHLRGNAGLTFAVTFLSL